MRLLKPKSRNEVTTTYRILFINYFVKYIFLLISISLDWLLTSNAHLKKEYDHSEKPKKDKGPEQGVKKASIFVKNICDLPLDRSLCGEVSYVSYKSKLAALLFVHSGTNSKNNCGLARGSFLCACFMSLFLSA